MNDTITMNLYYTGENGAARRFMEEMEKSGVADEIRLEEGCLRYEYFLPASDPETVLLIDVWQNKAALDRHHQSALMPKISALREKYDLHMRAERYIKAQEEDGEFIRK